MVRLYGEVPFDDQVTHLRTKRAVRGAPRAVGGGAGVDPRVDRAVSLALPARQRRVQGRAAPRALRHACRLGAGLVAAHPGARAARKPPCAARPAAAARRREGCLAHPLLTIASIALLRPALLLPHLRNLSASLVPPRMHCSRNTPWYRAQYASTNARVILTFFPFAPLLLPPPAAPSDAPTACCAPSVVEPRPTQQATQRDQEGVLMQDLCLGGAKARPLPSPSKVVATKWRAMLQAIKPSQAFF